ncbi:MAG: S9 family peptidase [Acidimicrobiia bacterium]|nr:S9 family peptidase [Acidimicrobiia bacterium]
MAAVARYDVAEGSWQYVLERPWDTSCRIDWTGNHLLVETNEDGTTAAELVDPEWLERTGAVSLPARGVASFGFLATAGCSPIRPAHRSSRVTPGSTTWKREAPPASPRRRARCRPRRWWNRSCRFSSFDGEQVAVFLYRPRASNPPVVVYLHGGPESQYAPSFNPLIQYLVARGYAVAAPNVRGSTGYGKRFSHLDDRTKRLDAVSDLAALHDWLGATAGVNARRAALFGGSYGGYMVLAGLAFQPERWAAGVSVVGISSLKTFLENTSPWRRKFREREYGRLDTDGDFLLIASPLTHADDIRAPLFLIHGENDPRVPVGEARQIHNLLEAKGIRTELVVYPDEGHGLGKLKNRLDAYPRAAAFLDDVLRP